MKSYIIVVNLLNIPQEIHFPLKNEAKIRIFVVFGKNSTKKHFFQSFF